MKLIIKRSVAVTVLPDSESVRKMIKKVFATSGRKMAIVAFVGQDAETYMGDNLRGMEIYCWPRAGGTNPYAIQDLRDKFGCKVYFADKLHMKIFWSRDGGCVIGSANLTNNALGENGLKEAGVYFSDSSKVDIDKIIKSIHGHPVTTKMLLKLIDAHKKYFAKNGTAGVPARKKRSFLDWHASHPRELWKLGWWEEETEFSEAATQIARKEYSLKEPKEFLYGKKGNFTQDDWVLMYKINEAGTIYPNTLRWLYIERLINSKEVEDWPYEAIQFRPAKHFPHPPFRIDTKFRKAFKAVGENLSKDLMMPEKKRCLPPKRLINQLAKLLRR